MGALSEMLSRTLLTLLVVVAGCSSDRDRPADAGATWNEASVPDLATPDSVPDGEIGLDTIADSVEASDYCEQIVDAFCPFYLRCGRVAAEDEEGCRGLFLEMCNEVFEPRYVALEQAGLLQLSVAGIVGCRAHLAQVPCEQHLMDLAGPCREMWQGLSPQGSPCGLDIETFICDRSSTCRLDLSLCGSCESAADTGGLCSDLVHCKYPDECVEGTCAPPALPGQSCTDSNCILGAVCQGGTCQARSYVAVGEICDSMHRCVPGSVCQGGSCVQARLLGQPCSTTEPCASGYCDPSSQTCKRLIAPQQPCSENGQCLSARCQQGTCGGLISGCLI